MIKYRKEHRTSTENKIDLFTKGLCVFFLRNGNGSLAYEGISESGSRLVSTSSLYGKEVQIEQLTISQSPSKCHR